MPGGGYSNLDLFERLALAPGVTAASILGEGTFHQFHGGTTTNVEDSTKHRDLVASYGDHFEALRGRRLARLDRPVKFVGAFEPAGARRTRSRRNVHTSYFDALRDPVDHSDQSQAIPVSDELKLAAIEAVWDQQAWREATWLGHRVNRFPTDLQTYQELVSRLRPGVVILAGDDDGLGGRAVFFASIFDGLGHGKVIAVGRSKAADRPEHPRVTHLEGQPEHEDVADQVTAHADGQGDAMVFLALGHNQRVGEAFDRYSPLVPVGGYVVVENTIVNGRPVAAGFGAGPLEGVYQLLGTHRDFIIDPTLERYTVTFNRNGYLKRLEPR